MHQRGENWCEVREGDPDCYQNLVDYTLGHAPPLQKFRQNSFITFLHTDTPTDHYINNLLGGHNKLSDATVHLCLYMY